MIEASGLNGKYDKALEKGNNMGIGEDKLTDTLEWLEDDLKMEVNDDNDEIPLNREGARVVYTLNPRELKFFPLSISAIAKIFYAAGEDWTISTRVYDVTNYAYFSGDDRGALELSRRHSKEVERLGSKLIAWGECGHGYRSYRWEGPNWMRENCPVDSVSIPEFLAEYIRTGSVKPDPSLNKKLTTLHDPCNLVRSGGIVEDQRYILRSSVTNFVEMTPNRENNYCCGGGGGQLAMGEYADRRIKARKVKADQISRTGASFVATPCHSCIDQIMELNHHYKLNIEIKTIGEIVADAIIL
ncbi:MAG TPA: (Fe-S)-binding protein [Bacteroidales bacterium]|nr:(Fe-S)-binding protein [Bacteroidales bacterium]